MYRELKDNLQFGGRYSEFRSRRASIVLSVVFFLAAICSAQIDRSGLSGTVTDSVGPAAAADAHHGCAELDPTAARNRLVPYRDL